MTIKLYHMKQSRSLRVLWLLEELGLPYELDSGPMDRKKLKSSEYLEKNPLGKTPVMYDGDQRIMESLAALQYLSERYAEGKLSRKPTDPDYADFLQLFHFGEAGIGGAVGMLLGHTVLLPEEQRIPAMKLWAEAEVINGLNYLENALREDAYLLDDFSLADISVVYLLFLLKITRNAGAFGEKTAAYFKKVTARPAWQRACDL